MGGVWSPNRRIADGLPPDTRTRAHAPYATIRDLAGPLFSPITAGIRRARHRRWSNLSAKSINARKGVRCLSTADTSSVVATSSASASRPFRTFAVFRPAPITPVFSYFLAYPRRPRAPPRIRPPQGFTHNGCSRHAHTMYTSSPDPPASPAPSLPPAHSTLAQALESDAGGLAVDVLCQRFAQALRITGGR